MEYDSDSICKSSHTAGKYWWNYMEENLPQIKLIYYVVQRT